MKKMVCLMLSLVVVLGAVSGAGLASDDISTHAPIEFMSMLYYALNLEGYTLKITDRSDLQEIGYQVCDGSSGAMYPIYFYFESTRDDQIKGVHLLAHPNNMSNEMLDLAGEVYAIAIKVADSSLSMSGAWKIVGDCVTKDITLSNGYLCYFRLSNDVIVFGIKDPKW